MSTNSPHLPPASSGESEELYRKRVAAVLELEHRKCATDPFHFIVKYLLTEDSQDLDNPYKPFPERCYDYLRHLLDYILTEPLLAIEKSRQVMVTWLMAAYSLWLCLFHKGVMVRIQSKKKEDVEDIIDRISVLYRSMPNWLKARHPAKIIGDRIRFPMTRSKIVAVPQGAGHHRGPTPTLVWNDETADQSDLPAIWKALRPSLAAGKGRVVFTSTQAQSWFSMLTKDLLTPGEAPPPTEHKELSYGLTMRRLKRNRFCVLRLHYSADPEKRLADWIEKAKAGMSEADWQQEMEINPDAKAGVPALPKFTLYQDNILCTPFDIPPHWPRFAAFDHGTRSPTSIHLYAVDPLTEVSYAYWEYYRPGPLGDHLDALKAHPDFPVLQMILLDASCWAQTQQVTQTLSGQMMHSVRSIAELCQDAGVYCTPAARVDDKTKIAVWDRAWQEAEQKRPAFRIFRSCVSLTRELPGIVWAEYSEEQQRTHNTKEKLVDKDNHAFDDASYWLLYRYSSSGDSGVPEQAPADLAEAAARHWRVEHEKRVFDEMQARQDEMAFEAGYDD